MNELDDQPLFTCAGLLSAFALIWQFLVACLVVAALFLLSLALPAP